ncbi:uncharacterized protein E5676_scaffold96G00810 [Cucumis melo var. makuwa]|uniref:Integrase zinc-binding domain-containing protein n=1 Tax=Cucumis melo var. makuwa TaxID=1194695 RepID=A0A5D3CY19_CUCMM|nr:uncharacterized protein E6C27_scaffold134G00840 [Cucumis melo var. makuwa]TYK16813.1 uncharacterized protein E5676_scaffold96G00810 [Cucumis melo var. makuwa]
MPKSTMRQLGILMDKLSNSKLVIQGFNQGSQRTIGMIRLELTIGDLKASALFYVIDSRTTYKLLLGHPWIYGNGVIALTLHQCFQFYQDGVKKVKADFNPFLEVKSHFTDAKKPHKSTGKGEAYTSTTKSMIFRDEKASNPPVLCYVPLSRSKKGDLSLVKSPKGLKESEIETPKKDIEDVPLSLEEGGQSTIDELKEVNLDIIKEPRPTFVGAALTNEEKDKYMSLLIEYRDIFAKSYKEMLRLDPKKVFDDMLHKHVECYVDDLVVKSKRRQDHLKDLKVVSDACKKYPEVNVTTSHLIDEEDWRQSIIEYLEHGKLPKDSHHKTKEESIKALKEVYAGVCGVHQSGPKLQFQLRRMNYYWPKMI